MFAIIGFLVVLYFVVLPLLSVLTGLLNAVGEESFEADRKERLNQWSSDNMQRWIAEAKAQSPKQ